MPDNNIEKTSSYIRVNHRYCPKCRESMKVITVEKPVKTKPHEMNDGLRTDGKMKVYKTQFYCSNCRMKYTLEDLNKIDLMNKKKNS